MHDAARVATIVLRVVALCMMAVGPISLVGQAAIGPEAFRSPAMVLIMLGGAVLYMLPGYLLYRLAPRLGRFVARRLE